MSSVGSTHLLRLRLYILVICTTLLVLNTLFHRQSEFLFFTFYNRGMHRDFDKICILFLLLLFRLKVAQMHRPRYFRRAA